MKKVLYLLTAGAVGACVFSCNNPTSATKPPLKINIYNQQVKIAYTDDGQADTTLLFVHGWCINKSYWTDQITAFSKKYRVVTMDLPGFGQSGKNRKQFNTAAFSSDVSAVISQLQLKNVILIGHSMAGDIVVQAAINAPQTVIALVGIDNFKNVGIKPANPKQAKEDYANAIDALKHHFKATTFDYFNQELFFRTTDINIRRRILGDVARVDTIIATACMAQDDFDETAMLIKARKKLYLINSDVNPTDTTGLIAKKIPFQLLYIHATGHFPMVEQPGQFNSLLSKVLNNIWASTL